MKKWLLIISLLCILIPEAAHATTIAETLQTLMKSSWAKTSAVWPTSQFSNYFIVLTDGKTATYVSRTERKSLAIATLQGRIPNEGGYEKWAYNQQNGIIIRQHPQMNANDYFTLATHELFHFNVQPSWNVPQTEASRATMYPFEASPRIYRNAAIHQLIAAYEQPTKRNTYIAQAAYFYRLWQTKYKYEANAIAETDRSEGTAKYFEKQVEYMTVSNKMTKRAFMLAELKKIDLSDSIDDESYDLGFVAGLVADEANIQWKNALPTSSLTIADYLFRNVTSQKTTAPSTVTKPLTTSINELNETYRPQVEPTIKAFLDTKTPLLLINTNNLVGSFSLSMFIQTKQVPYTLMTFASYQTDSLSVIERPTLSGFNDQWGNNEYFIIPLYEVTYTLKGTTLLFNSESISGQVTIKQQRQDNGKLLFIAD